MAQLPPGHFDFSQQRRTFRLELLRSAPQGLVATAFMTFAIFIAIREFGLPSWMKGAILGSSSIGLLMSLFVVQLIRRVGCSVNRMTGSLWALSSIGFLVAAFSAGRPWLYMGATCAAFIGLGAGLPLMAQIYRKHYADHSRGRLFSISSLTRTATVATAGWAFGLWLQHGSFQGLFLVYALSCLMMAACVTAMAPVRLRISNRIRWFDAMQHVRDDRPFRKLLIAWMFLGFGNLIAMALFVEYIGNPRYGFALAADRSGLITSTIPMVAAMATVVPWGAIFDRLPFYSVRALINLVFVAAILIYYLGGGIVGLFIGMALHGIARSGGEILWALWTTRFADGERVAEYQSVHSFMTGVRGLISPFIAFAVVESAGPVTVAWISSGLMLFSTLMILPEVIAEWRRKRQLTP
ncbi:MAG: MFS transporter [Akkermansiaceae bacterium]|nr:MFS transporter [Akkermansiaceae bacterium]